MWHWTYKSLMVSRLGLVTSVAAAGFAFALVMVFEAVFAGESEQIVAYVKHADADVWVMQRGVDNMHMSTSYLSDSKVSQITDVSGVDSADAILYLNTVVGNGKHQWFSYVVGLNVPSTSAGPWAMASGKAQPSNGEAVVPRVLANMSGRGLGDTIRITDHEFVIVGLSEGTFSMANSVIFVTKSDLEDIMTSMDIVSFVLVKTNPDVQPAEVARAIEHSIDKVHALPATQFVINDRQMAMQMGVETIAIMTVIGGALAVLLVAFTLYSQVSRQRRELAVAKALGATNRSLYLSVSVQASVITLASVACAILITLATLQLTSAFVPQVTLLLMPSSVVRITVVGLLVALIASLIAARQIARVDPLTAFQTQ